jgi:myo-inositol-1(or 4)-monophosphatase
VLVVDPIDGTRPAMAGFESSCVSIAAAPLGDGGEPTMADVEIGAIVEIKTGAHFLSRRGGGVEASVPLRLSPNTDLEVLFWVYGFRARPVRVYVEVLGELIDAASLRGGTFELGSATYDMTRVVTGQLDAYIEPGPLILERHPQTREDFLRVGGGVVLNNSPYDVAAAVLICREAGAIVTDCAGRPLDDRPLLGSGPDYQMSILAAANAELHGLLIQEVERGLRRLG